MAGGSSSSQCPISLTPPEFRFLLDAEVTDTAPAVLRNVSGAPLSLAFAFGEGGKEAGLPGAACLQPAAAFLPPGAAISLRLAARLSSAAGFKGGPITDAVRILFDGRHLIGALTVVVEEETSRAFPSPTRAELLAKYKERGLFPESEDGIDTAWAPP